MAAQFIPKARASARFFYKCILTVIALGLLSACQTSKPSVDFAAILSSQKINPDRAALLMTRLETGESWSNGGARLDQRFIAASTSKIPHTFIGLEDVYVTGPDMLFKWDGVERWAAGWNQDQTMRQAYARSAVWVYQDITRNLGPAIMAAGLKMFDYGNVDIGGTDDITTYWLNGPLKISAREQVQFLTSLYLEDFPLKLTSYREGKEIMASGRDDGRFAKTGWYY